MQTIHRTTMKARCPHGGADFYLVEFHVGDQFRTVESIREEIERVTRSRPTYQEDLTQHLADRLKCRVVTAGRHGEFETRCEATPREGA